jgi:hypothetical protein
MKKFDIKPRFWFGEIKEQADRAAFGKGERRKGLYFFNNRWHLSKAFKKMVT